MATLKGASTGEFAANATPTHSDIQSGCLQRIAAATELMAKDHARLVDDCNRYKQLFENISNRNHTLRRRVAALKGQITKLRKRLDAAEAAKGGE
jgi:hypothetical protein